MAANTTYQFDVVPSNKVNVSGWEVPALFPQSSTCAYLRINQSINYVITPASILFSIAIVDIDIDIDVGIVIGIGIGIGQEHWWWARTR